jgi:hypothetical protein
LYYLIIFYIDRAISTQKKKKSVWQFEKHAI